MKELTSIERMSNMLHRKPIDRIPVFEHFWGDTYNAYLEQGHIKDGELVEDNLNLDMTMNWTFNLAADINFENQVIEETENTRLIKDGNGAVLRWYKKHNTTPEHVDFYVKERKQWEEKRPLLLEPDEKRINFEGYRQAKAAAKSKNRFFCWAGVNVFEQMHPICGHEYMLMGMAEDPDWILDMAEVYTNLSLNLQEILFAKEGKPDGIFYYDDLGFKERPFMSPNMYKEIIFPSHKRTVEHAHSQNLPVILHSCGFVEPLLPGFVEAGFDCLQAIEIKSGMDLVRIYKNFGDVLSFMGGIDVRVLYINDKIQIDKELEAKIPIVKQGNGYCLHSDHSIPVDVKYETLKYFIEKGLSLGQY